MTKEILRKETRFAVHLPKNGQREDAHYIKEHIYYKDGTSTPNTFMVKDYKRPVWVTKQNHRDHNDKKEFEEVSKLFEQKATQSDLNRVVATMLDKPYAANRPSEIKDSPYVYGYDQTSTSLIKLKSLHKNKFIQSPYTVSAFDIETTLDTKEVLIATIAFNNKVHTCILSKFLKGLINLESKVNQGIDKYLPTYSGKLDLTLTVHETEVDLLTAVFKTANEWGPDFLAIWNINFDIPTILKRLKINNTNPIDVICDTTIPRPYRVCRYKEGMTNKVMAGKQKPVPPSLQWHSLFSTTTFHAIDAMCVYRQIRMAKQEEPSYSLDAILQKVLGKRKLSFVEADEYSGGKWHIFMQENYPIEYIVYNIWDCLGMLELDAITKDLSSSLPAGAAMTDFTRFNSNPKKIVDALFLFGLERGLVVGTAGTVPDYAPVPIAATEEEDSDEDEEEDEDDGDRLLKSLGLKGWIQLLPQNHLLAEGLKCLEEFPEVVTSVRGTVADVDATAAYPTATLVSNASKATCVNELISIEGIDEEIFREQNLSVCMGGVNSLEYFNIMFGMPAMDAMDAEIDSMLA